MVVITLIMSLVLSSLYAPGDVEKTPQHQLTQQDQSLRERTDADVNKKLTELLDEDKAYQQKRHEKLNVQKLKKTQQK